LADIGLDRVRGNLALNLSVNKLLSFESQEFPTRPSVENAGTLARGGQLAAGG